MDNKESSALTQLIKLQDKNIAVSFSGGKDSLVTVDLALRAGIERVVFSNTTIEFDETIHYVEKIGSYYDIQIDIIKAPITFFEMVDHVGLPSRRFRWCCDVFKFGPLARYAKQYNLFGFVTGLRNNESYRRRNYNSIDDNPLVPVKQINPIVNFSDKYVWSYIKKYNLPINPLYKHFNRIGCWCCPYRTKKDWEYLRIFFPEKYEYFKTVLLNHANRLNIKDKHKFVNERGWTAWASPSRKTPIGKFDLRRSNDSDDKYDVDLMLESSCKEKIQRILNLLPILTDNYFATDNQLKLTINRLDVKKLRILVEKAINCVGCGACISMCKFDALKIKDGSIFLNPEKCTQCRECLVASNRILRGACIVRNYSENRAVVLRNYS